MKHDLRTTVRSLALALWAGGLLVLASACASTGSSSGAATEGGEEAPPEREVVIRFSGLERLSRGDLLDAVGDELVDFRRSGYRKWPIDDAAYRMEQRFAKEGYPFTEVDYEIEAADGAGEAEGAASPRDATQGPVRVQFIVRPGPRTRLVDVLFEGARAYGADTLRAFFGFEDGVDRWYVRSDIGSGLSALEERYLNDGYADVRVGPSDTLFDETREHVTVTVQVSEGPRYTVREAALEVDVPELEEAFAQHLDKVQGETFRLRLPYEVRAKLIEEMGERGYIEATVEMDVERVSAEGAVDLSYRVQAGERVVIDAIEIRGNEATDDKTILRGMAFEPGDLYTRSGARTSFERLYRLGIFRGVSVEPERREDGTWACVVEVEEDQTADWFIEPGYGSYERARLTLGFRERNLFGRAVPLRAQVTGGEYALRGEISLAQPGLFGIDPDLTGELKLFGGRREEPSFTEQELGVTTGVSYRWSRALSGGLEYQFKRTDVIDVLVTDPESEAALGDIDVSSIAASLSLDTRDHIFLPGNGGNSRVSVEFADESLGSELDFTRFRFTQSLFHQLGEKTVLAFGWQVGLIMAHGATDDIPLQERFFNGGESSVRSFAEDELGPTGTNDKPVGGEAYSVFSAEVRQELVGNLGGALFVDFGSLADEAEDVFDFGNIETGLAIGVGVRYFLPIGPVRVDVGWNPEAGADEDDVVAHLSVGMAF